jgi:23S rRNA pseudouridine1911/1915/1917 synthase
MDSSSKISAEEASQRLDKFLAIKYPEISRSQWKKLIKLNSIRVNNLVVQPKTLLNENDIVAVLFEKSAKSPVDIEVIYEDNDVIVIDKPAGVLSHSKNNFDNEYTVADFLYSKSKDLEEADFRTGIVHRLDRLTSGVMILAKNINTQSFLSKQFAERKITKFYVALVAGKLRTDEFKIDAGIQRDSKRPNRFKASSSGKSATTIVKLIKYFENDDISVVLLKPETGRTHQLRVHMNMIEHPIIGDVLYAKPSKRFNRTMLHAYSLEISTKPKQLSKIFTAKIPKDMSSYIDEAEVKKTIYSLAH